jgi:hypothetical protein
MSDDPVEVTISKQLEKLKKEGKLNVQPSNRCRICQDEHLRTLVNKLIGYGLNNIDIMGIVEPLNEGRARNKQITRSVLWGHINRHFNVLDPALAIFREILERRDREAGGDFEKGVGSKITALAYLETMMVKGYATMVDENTEVSPTEGARAAVQLEELIRKNVGATSTAEVMVKFNAVMSALFEVVPPEYHQAIVDRLDNKAITSRPLDVDIEDDVYDPTADFDEEDD